LLIVSLRKGRRVISTMDPVYISNGAYSILIDDFTAWSGNYFLSREVHYLMLYSPGLISSLKFVLVHVLHPIYLFMMLKN